MLRNCCRVCSVALGELFVLDFHLEDLVEEGLQAGFGLFEGDARLEAAEGLRETRRAGC